MIVRDRTPTKGPTTGFRTVLFGAAPDTSNLGVSALCWSIVKGLLARAPDCQLTVFDFSRGVREQVVEVEGLRRTVVRCGAAYTRRLYRPEALARIRLAARIGGLRNPAAQAIGSARAVLDVSAGDSFTDLYGDWRFRSVVLPKLIAIENARPLMLLPQTYGPFADPGRRRLARWILRESTMAWARDARSLEVVEDILGGDFDPDRHRPGVDVAFGLDIRAPSAHLPEPLATWLTDGQAPVIGLNVSGLLYRHPETARANYGLRGDYRDLVHRVLSRFLERTEARIILVPHVVSPPSQSQSDVGAIRSVIDTLHPRHRARVAEAPTFTDPSEAKWLISQLDWFCGTRMHATIAALSSGVPAAAVSYSDKALGVFETCGQGEHVADPRHLGAESVVEGLWESWCRREEARAGLRERLPVVLAAAGRQMDELVAALRGLNHEHT